METHIIIGNAISLGASAIMVASNYIKSRQKTLFWQTIQIILNTISCFVIGSYSGTIVNALSIPRNILAYKEKLVLSVKLILWTATISLSLYFNTKGVIGYFPLISTTLYIFLMDKLGDAKFKMLVITTLVLWGIHDFAVQNYVQGAFDIASIVTASLAIYRIKRGDTVTYEQ